MPSNYNYKHSYLVNFRLILYKHKMPKLNQYITTSIKRRIKDKNKKKFEHNICKYFTILNKIILALTQLKCQDR